MILVIDLENTCVRKDEMADDYHGQIIEIGAAWTTHGGEVLDQFSVLVQAENPITEFCTRLTGITQNDVDGGLTFAAAMEALGEFAAKYPSTLWASWGVSDLNSFEFDCAHHGVENPLEDWTHRNLKIEFALANGSKRRGLDRALRTAGIEREGVPHRALPDAMNTVKLMPYIAAGSVLCENLQARERARREELWNLESPMPGQREQALKTLKLIEGQDRRSPIGDGAALTTRDLRKIVKIVPASGTTIAHVVESEIPQPWRERFQQASVGSTRQSQDTAYAHDWLKFLESWDKESDYQR